MSPPSDQDNRPRRGEAGPTDARTARPAASVELELTAEWVAPSIARDRVRRWLTALRWSPAHVDDLVLAVSEAVSNSVEHGYGMSTEDADHSTLDATLSTVKLDGQIITDAHGIRRVEFTIRDHGHWTPPGGPSSRGHGMTLMRACTDDVTIEHSTAGTTVVLRSRALPTSRPMPFPERPIGSP